MWFGYANILKDLNIGRKPMIGGSTNQYTIPCEFMHDVLISEKTAFASCRQNEISMFRMRPKWSCC